MNKNIIKKYSILIPILILLTISIFTMYKNTILGTKQLIIAIIAIILLLIISKINIKYIINKSIYIYIINIVLLLLVLFIGKNTNGSKAWLSFKYFKIQPSELMKISLLLVLIKYHKKNIIYLLLLTLIPSVLCYLEPDTGSILFYLIILFSILITTKQNKIIPLIIILLLLLITTIYLYYNYEDIFIKIFGTSIFYRIDRLISFKNQNNLQLENALISIGSHNYIYFPEYHNDFIFAFILSKYNLLITIIILINYFYILYYLTSKKNIINTTTFYILLFQTFYNILMNIGLVPIIGIPLPFLSYGGSYLITLSIIIGMTINIYNMDKLQLVDK